MSTPAAHPPPWPAPTVDDQQRAIDFLWLKLMAAHGENLHLKEQHRADQRKISELLRKLEQMPE